MATGSGLDDNYRALKLRHRRRIADGIVSEIPGRIARRIVCRIATKIASEIANRTASKIASRTVFTTFNCPLSLKSSASSSHLAESQ